MTNGFWKALVVCAAALTGACTATEDVGGLPSDPYEQDNRAAHAFNKAVDRAILKPGSETYVTIVPGRARTGISNFASNLSQPLNFINHSLQGDIDDAAVTLLRFAMNSTFGLGGLLDPATEAGLFNNDTDFGETMAVWGARQGAYLEIPFLGPSSERDFAGTFVDLAMNPLNFVLNTPESNYVLGARVGDVLNTRNEFAGLIDTLLYESADSYSAARIAYLQNKTRELGAGLAVEDLEDPYAFE